MSRLSLPYRATTDLDTVHQREPTETATLTLLLNRPGTIPDDAVGVLVPVGEETVKVDVIDVTRAEILDLRTTRTTGSASWPTRGPPRPPPT